VGVQLLWIFRGLSCVVVGLLYKMVVRIVVAFVGIAVICCGWS